MTDSGAAVTVNTGISRKMGTGRGTTFLFLVIVNSPIVNCKYDQISEWTVVIKGM